MYYRLEAKYSQLVPLTTRGVLTGTKHFQNLAVRGHWFVDELNVNGLINDVDVSAWQTDTVMKNRKFFFLIVDYSLLFLLLVQFYRKTPTDWITEKYPIFDGPQC